MNIVKQAMPPLSNELIAKFRAIVGDKYAVTDPADIAATAFPMDDVRKALETTIEAQRVVVLADACHGCAPARLGNYERRAQRWIRHDAQRIGVFDDEVDISARRHNARRSSARSSATYFP